MESCRTRLTAQQLPSFGADEAPAHVDVPVVAVGLLCVEVIGANDGGVGDHFAACSHTQITDVIRHRAAQTTHQPTLGGLVLGAAAVVAAQAGVKWATEAFVVEHGERTEANTRLMVKLATVWDVAASHLALRLLTCETRVDSCAALLTQQLILWFQRQTETLQVKHPTALAFTGHQVLTCMFTHLAHKLFLPLAFLCPV